MKKLFLILVLLVLISCGDSSKQIGADGIRECPVVSVRFSPKGGITQSIVESIDGAERDVYIQAFAFTSVPIAESLVRAKKRGKKVEAVLDRENLRNKNSVIKLLHDNDIKIYIDDRHAIQHNKVIIVDINRVLTGSFNLSKGAEEHNAENSITIIDAKVAEIYFENWNLHKEHSKPYSSDE